MEKKKNDNNNIFVVHCSATKRNIIWLIKQCPLGIVVSVCWCVGMAGLITT